MNDNAETAMRLRKAMTDANITQRELAERSGVKESSISHYVTGRHAPSNVSAAKMAEVLDTDPLYLMGFDETYSNDNKSDNIDLDLIKQSAERQKRLRNFYASKINSYLNEASEKSGYDYSVFPRVSSSPEEAYLIEKYRAMPAAQQKRLLAYVMGFCKGADLDDD